jgi:anthranilate phosphoribosyltransferase
MSFSRLIRQMTGTDEVVGKIGNGDVHDLFSAMLDGGVADLELSAMLVALPMMLNTVASVAGSYRAVVSRVRRVHLSGTTYRSLVFASYGTSGQTPNLLPWLALALRRLDVPVLVHGSLGGSALAASASPWRGMGILD